MARIDPAHVKKVSTSAASFHSEVDVRVKIRAEPFVASTKCSFDIYVYMYISFFARLNVQQDQFASNSYSDLHSFLYAW